MVQIDKHNVQKYLQNMDMKSAKLGALILVVLLAIWHSLLHLMNGNDSCDLMLKVGRMESQGSWQAQGCMMHKYTKKDSQKCFKYIYFWGGKTNIAFIGDSRIRELYLTFVNKISKNVVKLPEEKHQDIKYTDDEGNTKVNFYWRPFLGSDYSSLLKSWKKLSPSERPNFILTGSATWAIKYLHHNEGFKSHTTHLTKLLPHFEALKESTQILWMVQDPVIESQLKESRKMITNSEIDKYNRAAVKILDKSSVIVWSSSRLVAESNSNMTGDGLHFGEGVTKIDSQILLNLYCNAHMNHKDGGCCIGRPEISPSQVGVAGFFLLCIIISVVHYIVQKLQIKKKTPTSPETGKEKQENGVHNQEPNATMECIDTLAKFGIIMAYFFVCDRANFFMKENKHYSHLSFFIPAVYIIALGFYFTRISKKFENGNHGDKQFLHRDQSDEWKGWLQLVILLYHITGASKVLPIYVTVRVLVSSYLFLSGYGHFTYFYTKADFSFHRFCTVLFRMNFQVFMMCLVMDRPYQAYYFVPLVSFWYVVIYVTMATWPRVTQSSAAENSYSYFEFLLKIFIVVMAMAVLFKSEVLFERVFLTSFIKGLFISADHTVDEWRFRWQLDRYMTLSGMLFAFIIQVGRKYNFINDSEVNTVRSKKLLFICVIAFLGCMSHFIFATTCRSKQECNNIHPYISHVPVISFLLLRNMSGFVRIRYSYFFAWFGRISLELFVSQYHIWLAADTHGILVLVPGFPAINILVTTFIFVCCSHELSGLITKLTAILVPKATGPLVRNVSIFLAFLIAAATSHGFWGV